jgi:hypothetical protein
LNAGRDRADLSGSRAAARDAHLPFFRAGIAVLLSAGAVWGAVLLVRVAVSESFTAISIHEVNAHGHAQIFGWVGLFVMGFAYRMFVRWESATAVERRAAAASLAMMIGGIGLRVLGEPLHDAPAMRSLTLAGAAIEIAAIGIFATIVVRAVLRPDRVIPAERPYVVAAVALFFVQAVYEAVLLLATTGAESRQQLLAIVSIWQAPLRDLQIHGFALLMILGVGLWLFPRTFGLARPSERLVAAGWVAILAAVALESSSFVLLRTTGHRAWAGSLYVAILVLAVTTVALTWRWLPGAGTANGDRSVKFVRSACAWLSLSMSMLVLVPAYMFVVLPAAGNWSASGLHAVEIGFSHAYYGAVRHAITVGFISQTIMGVSARVVPMLAATPTRNMNPLWLPFLLVNAGCAMRVTLQVATDFVEPAFAVVGASGAIEVAGFAIWSAHLWRAMSGRGVATAPRRALVAQHHAP